MSYFATIIGSVNVFNRGRIDDDFTDRLNYEVTGNVLLGLAMLVSFKQFGGKPMECIVPEQVHDSVEDFAENYCFTKNTYFLSWGDYVPKDVEVRKKKEISYYQWIPFFLLLEAACFQIPYLIWKLTASQSGIKIHDLVQVARDPKNLQKEVRQSSIDTLTTHLENALKFHRRMERRNLQPHLLLRCFQIRYTASYVSTLYIFVKFLYLLNNLAQFFLMNLFLEADKHGLYGWGALRDILNGTEWESSGIFPRVTICDFQVRTMANVHRYSIQCVLTINMFNEKIFIFLWFWYQIMILFTSISWLYWTTVLVVPCFSRSYITQLLELCEMEFDADDSKKDIHRFVHKYLQTDGLFCLRMVEAHSNVIFTSDLTMKLWMRFLGIEQRVVDAWKGLTGPSSKLQSVLKTPSSAPISVNQNLKDKNEAAEAAGVRWRQKSRRHQQELDERKGRASSGDSEEVAVSPDHLPAPGVPVRDLAPDVSASSSRRSSILIPPTQEEQSRIAEYRYRLTLDSPDGGGGQGQTETQKLIR